MSRLKSLLGMWRFWGIASTVALALAGATPADAVTCGSPKPSLKSASSSTVSDSTVKFYNLRSSLAGQNSKMTVVQFNLEKFKFASKLGTVSKLKGASDFIDPLRDSYFINADFFDLRTNYPRSSVVSKGQLQYLPQNPGVHLSLVQSGSTEKLTRSTPTYTNEISIFGNTLEFDSVNKFINRNATTIYSSAWGKRKAPSGTSTLVLNSNKEIIKYFPSGKSIVPQEGLVIQFGHKLKVPAGSPIEGQKVEINSSVAVSNKGTVLESVGRGESLITKGEIQVECSTSDRVRPRTAIGWDSIGNIWLVTVTSGEGLKSVVGGLRLGGSTKFQLAAAMQDLGIRDAVNLDGGSSTNLWMSRNKKLYRLDDKATLKSREIATGILFTKR